MTQISLTVDQYLDNQRMVDQFLLEPGHFYVWNHWAQQGQAILQIRANSEMDLVALRLKLQ